MAIQRRSEPTANTRPGNRCVQVLYTTSKPDPNPSIGLNPNQRPITPYIYSKVLTNALSPLGTIDFCLVRLTSNSTDTNDTRTASALAASAAYEASLVTSTVGVNTSEADGWNVSDASTLDKSLILPNYLNPKEATLDLSLCVNHTMRLRSSLSVRY